MASIPDADGDIVIKDHQDKSHPLDLDSTSSEKKKLKRPKIDEIQQKKDQVTRELNELKSRIEKRRSAVIEEPQESSDDEDFVDILDSAFNTSTANALDKDTSANLNEFDQFLEEHKKIDDKLVKTKQSKIFLLRNKTKKIRKSSSVSSLSSRLNDTHSNSIYGLDNSSKASLPGKLIRRISTRKGGVRDNASILTNSVSHNNNSELHKPPTLEEVSSETENELEDKEIITYKKVFRNNREITGKELDKVRTTQNVKKGMPAETTIMDDSDDNIETFQFQFQFSKIKLNEEKLKFSKEVNETVEKHTADEAKVTNTTTTLISNSHNGKITTTTIKPKQANGNKGLLSGLGISSGIASIYGSLFGWKKRQ
ncbi:hypothetical protein DASC09_016920 [Saccharomycopsis crataegensis]|uniref:Uncharacterized protein n=1 Tax=Saccharomycopsis crataegensis TaxID=43959 RepID=A0AAV5QIF6_9ASCO|nr:hypothetical protein DASC09_016920 [Saccharomycopsis crataegensis]